MLDYLIMIIYNIIVIKEGFFVTVGKWVTIREQKTVIMSSDWAVPIFLDCLLIF